MASSQRVRRWIGVGVFVVVAGIAVGVLPRLLPRSPVTILVLCVLAVLTMKLVEHRVHRWFQWWGDRHAARTPGQSTRSRH